jgi:hypothetical protein
VRQRSGLAARVLRIASNTARFRPGLPPVAELESDYCFTGSHWGAPRTIDDLDPQRLPYRFSLFGHGWEERPRFSDSYRGPLAYERMPEVYASTKILVDDANHATRPWASVNSRVFDALACETLVITNGIEGARETFGDALPTYASVPELEEKLRYYLEHPAERERAAETLRRTVQERHSYMLRAEQFRDILAEELTPRTRLEIRVPRSPTGSAGDSRALSFGIALADALRAGGYGVRVQVGDGARHGLFAPDAVITLGAAEAPVPAPGAVNLLWVIAPCDDLDPDSLEAFDHVFTTSNLLAQRWQEDLPESVEWLPPCTAVAPVEPPDGDVGGRLLFVGDAEGALDPLLRDALAAGYEVSVIGRGWTSFVASAVVEAEYLERESLRRLYPRCRAVLCAQSGEARAQGFPTPRALDVRAAGGVPVCAPVEGAEDFLQSFAAIAQPGPDGLKAALDELPTRGARAPEHDGWLRRNSFTERAGVFGRTVDRLLAARRQ